MATVTSAQLQQLANDFAKGRINPSYGPSFTFTIAADPSQPQYNTGSDILDSTSANQIAGDLGASVQYQSLAAMWAPEQGTGFPNAPYLVWSDGSSILAAYIAQVGGGGAEVIAENLQGAGINVQLAPSQVVTQASGAQNPPGTVFFMPILTPGQTIGSPSIAQQTSIAAQGGGIITPTGSLALNTQGQVVSNSTAVNGTQQNNGTSVVNTTPPNQQTNATNTSQTNTSQTNGSSGVETFSLISGEPTIAIGNYDIGVYTGLAALALVGLLFLGGSHERGGR
jgi:hypothetical protein